MEVIVAERLETIVSRRRKSGMTRHNISLKGEPVMKWCRFSKQLVVTLCSALIAVSAFAQFQTGNIYGKVQAKDGSALPGVTVTLSGIGAPQTTITDTQGNFRFLKLSPGTYGLKADLSGVGPTARLGTAVRV